MASLEPAAILDFVRITFSHLRIAVAKLICSADAEWQILDQGQACERFTRVADTAIRGHNNEQFRDMTVHECEDACCARACESLL